MGGIGMSWGEYPGVCWLGREIGGIQRAHDSPAPPLGDFLPLGPESWLWDKEAFFANSPLDWEGKLPKAYTAGPSLLRRG